MVDPTFVCIPRVRDLYHLFNVGGVSGESLLAGSERSELFVPVLFAGAFREFAARDFWAEAGLVAFLAPVFAGFVGTLGTGRVPAHLLLLSRSLLQSVLGRSAGLCSGRTAHRLPGRNFFSTDPAEHSSLLSLSRGHLHFDSPA